MLIDNMFARDMYQVYEIKKNDDDYLFTYLLTYLSGNENFL